VWLDPDCGLKTRTVDETSAKLRLVVEAARAGGSGHPHRSARPVPTRVRGRDWAVA
jgi:hypothetical protein